MKPRWLTAIAIALLLALVAAACGGGDDDETAGKEGQGGDELDEIDLTRMTRDSPSPDIECLYRPDLLMMSLDIADELVLGGFTRLEADSIADHVSPLMTADEQGFLLNSLALFKADAGLDSYLAAKELEDNHGIAAAPVLGVQLAGHWGFAPAMPRVSTTDVDVAYEPAGGETTGVVILDTGVGNVLPDGLDVNGDPEDTALPPSVSGHGTFVASVLRQVNPATAVTIRRLPGSKAGEMHGHDLITGISSGIGISSHLQTAVFVSDELEILTKLHTTAGAGAREIVVASGTYTCPGIAASGELFESLLEPIVSESRIVAAAGNGATSARFLPADSSMVVGVESVGRDSADWSNDGDVAAPGAQLVGHDGSGEVVVWSGTSFAAPVWLGLNLRGSVADMASTDESAAVLAGLSVVPATTTTTQPPE